MATFRFNAWMRRTQVRECFGALSLLVLLMQAPIPAGFMPDGAGSAFLKICSGLTADATDPLRHPGGHDTATMCPFAAGAPAGAAPALPTPIGGTVNTIQLPEIPFAPSLAAGRVGPIRAQSPRAPPALYS